METIYCDFFTGAVPLSICKNHFKSTRPSCKNCSENPEKQKPKKTPKKKSGVKKKTVGACDPLATGTHQGYIAEYNQRIVAYACLLEITILEDSNPQALSDEHRQLARKIRSLLEKEYQFIVQEFLSRCRRKDKSQVRIVLDALSAYALGEAWFVEGINTLRALNVEVDVKVKAYTIEDVYKLKASGIAVDNIRRVENRRGWAVALYDEARRIERSLKKKTTSETFGLYEERGKCTERTKYYRDAPRQLRTLYLRYAYLLSHKDLHREHLRDHRLIFPGIPQEDLLPQHLMKLLARTWLDNRLSYLQKIL